MFGATSAMNEHSRVASYDEKALDFWPVIPAALALSGRVEEARAMWAEGGAHLSQNRLRHSARFTGKNLDRLAEGMRLAGWDRPRS